MKRDGSSDSGNERPASGGRRRGPWPRRLGVLLGVAGLLGALAGVGLAAGIQRPQVADLAQFTPSLITRLHDRHGEPFASFAAERRIMLAEGEVPEILQQAILAAEDANFLQHGGIDPEGIVRAAIRNLSEGSRIGGSTLTMQLARKLYLTPEKTWRRKVEEAFLTVEIEKNFTKPQILTLYCNLMYLGHGNYGMAAAARSYFGKAVAELELGEAATLAGILQRPSAYSPYRRPDLVLQRRDYVLRRMQEEGMIDRQALAATLAEPLRVVPLTAERPTAPFFAEDARRYLQDRYGSETLLEKGLQVHTTLDQVIQRAAEEAMRDNLVRIDRRRGWRGPVETLEGIELETHELAGWISIDLTPGRWNLGLVLEARPDAARVRIGEGEYRLDRDGVGWTRRGDVDDVLGRGDVAWFVVREPEGEGAADGSIRIELAQEPELESAVVVLESATGAVRAMVGGWSFDRSEFNRATQALRQTGSAFKPFVYGAALEMGYTPADTIFDAPAVFPGADLRLSYSPRNFYRRYFGIVTLRDALEHSYNVSAVKLQDLIGADQVIDFAHRCGITQTLPPYPSLALGVTEVTPMELAGAYASIANQGIRVEPYFVESVLDRTGSVLEAHVPQAQKAMEPQIAYLLTHMLEGVIDRGTGAAARDLDLDLAGKTGTQDRFTDAWFAGFSPRYTVVVWVGYDQKRSIGRNMTGSEAALPVWKRIFATGLEEGWLAAGERFPVPPGVVLVPVERHTGLIPSAGAAQIVEEAFLEGTEPVQLFDTKWARIATLPWYQQRPFYIPKSGERMPDDIEDWSLVRAAWEEKERESSTGG